MMALQTHNLNAVRGEFVSLIVGYGVDVDASDVFACIRKTSWQDDYEAKFNIEVLHDDLAQGGGSLQNQIGTRYQFSESRRLCMGFIPMGR